MLHAKSPECGKNCSLANRDFQPQNTIKESKAGTPQQAKKTYAECAADQPDTSIKPTCKPAPAKDTSYQQPEKNSKQGQTQPNTLQHPMAWAVRKRSMIQSGQLQSPRKQSTKLVRGTVAL